MKNNKKLIVLTVLVTALRSVVPVYAMDVHEEDHKDEVAQEIPLSVEQRVEASQRLLEAATVENSEELSVVQRMARWLFDASMNVLHKALLDASANGSELIVRGLLAQNVQVDCKDENGKTPLILASERGHIGIVRRLLEAGADINAQDINGCSLLLYAVDQDYGELVRALLAVKAFVDVQDKTGVTPLMNAASRGNADMIALLLDARARVDIHEKKRDNTALMVAAYENNCAAVKALLREGCISEQINEQNKDGNTALIFAVSNNCVDIVTILLEVGADAGMYNNNGYTAVMIAVDGNYLAVLDVVLSIAKPYVNKQDKEGWSALMMAAQHGHTDAIAILLGHKASVEVKNNVGNTALLVAAENGHVDATRMLLEAESNVDVQNDKQRTALMCSVLANNNQLVNMLLEAKAEVDIKGYQDWTALMIAAYQGYTDMVKALIAAGSNPNLRFTNGCSVFGIAKQPGMLQVMVDARAERVRQEEPLKVIQRNIPDVSVMLTLAANRRDQWMVPWLLRSDLEADANAGSCGICATSFVERVINDGVELHRATQACPHVVCDECEELQYRAQAAPDTDRDRGIYLGQNAAGVDQWMMPGRVNLSRCPECRAEQNGPEFVPTAAQQAQFNQLKEEFKGLELARRLSRMLKRTNVLRRFIPEAGIIAIVDEYAAVSSAVVRVDAGN